MASSETVKAAQVNISLDHPRLVNTDPESIRKFLRRYDQYTNTVLARAKQLSTDASSTVTTESVRPVDLKFCVDVEYLESCMALGFIDTATDYNSLTNEDVRKFLDDRCRESKEVVTMESLDAIVERELRTDMKNTNATARMQDLFTNYHTILSRNGLKWIIKENQKIAVQHVLSAVRPVSLRDRLTSDLSFSHHNLRKDFTGFLKHSVRLAEAFQLVDCGPPGKTEKSDKKSRASNSRSGNRDGNNGSRDSTDTKKDKGDLPLCLWEPHRAKGFRHLLKDCRDCPQEEKKALYEKRTQDLAKDGPASSTRSKAALGNASGPSKPTTGRLAHPVNLASSPSCPIVVSDGLATLRGHGRCDDGSDESIASPQLAQEAVVKGIGKMAAISPVTIQVALKESDTPASFTFSRLWTVPRLVLELSAGQMALINVEFLVADDEIACEDLLVGLPILRHLGIDSRTLLERNWSTLTETDCASVVHSTASDSCGALGRLMIARLNSVSMATAPQTPAHERDPNRPRGDYYAYKYDVDPFPDPSLIEQHAETDQSTTHSEIEAMLARAKNEGFPDEQWDQLSELIWKHADDFGITFSEMPAKIEPLRIELTPDAHPIRVKLRNYSEEQRSFMKSLVADLIQHNCVYANPTAKWASAPLLVPKPGPDGWRFTVDLRPVNQFTVRHHFPMPILEQELTKVASSRCYSNFDFTHGYWQLPLHKDSQESQSFITPDGVYTPNRVPHGTTNAVTNLQSSLTHTLPEETKEQTLLWLDDCLLHESTVPRLLDVLRSFLEYCSDFNWKLHPAKCVLYTRSVRWCGRIISADGIRHDPKCLDGLLRMDCPITGGQLQQFLCAMQWLRSSIPEFQSLVSPLHEFVETVYQHAGKRTKRAVARVSLIDLGWTSAHTTAFSACKNAIAKRVTLAHRDKNKRLCIYTDASDSHWSGILTQVPFSDLSAPHRDQAHEPLAFHSGRFSDVQIGWSTLEKEAYAVLATLERSHWLAACPEGFDLFTDHNNLIFLFDPVAVKPDIGQAALRKVLRWAVRISVYNYVFIHIRGVDNLWADLLTRWTIPLTIRRLISIPPLPTTFREFEWPSLPDIQVSQQAASAQRPTNLVHREDVFRHPQTDSIWIPDGDTDLQLRLAIIAHTGVAGHRGRLATEQALSKHFFWSSLPADIQLFVQSCIHCVSTKGGETVPRPFGPAIHGTKPNDLVQFDYIELGGTPSGEKYVLMLRDDHSGYSFFYPCSGTSADVAANALVDWSAAFGAPTMLMSDGPTHFQNETIQMLAKGLRAQHHFTLPYCPWSNGAVERLGKELLRTARALLSELQLRQDEWPQLIPIFQSAINNSPSPQRNNVAPITAFTGRPSSPPISTFLRNSDAVPVTVTDAQREKAINIQTIIKAMNELHPLVDQSVSQQRQRIRECRHKGELANFREGDYVLVARDTFHEGEKLCLRWRGPRRVIKAINDYAFQVEDLHNGNLETVHGTRLKYYHDASLNTTAILSHVLSSETGMPVSRLLKLIEQDGELFVSVRWKGLSPEEDTMEPLKRVYEDVPQLLLKLLKRQNTPSRLREKASAELGL